VRVTISRRYLIPLVCLIALGAADATTGYLRRTYPRGLFAPPPVEREVRFLAEPYALRPFAATDLDGRDVSLSTWRGRVAVVNFWATWCVPCRKEIPALVTLQEKFKTDVIVVGVLDDGSPMAFVRAFAESLRINYPIVRTTTEIEHSFSPVLVLPTTYVVDTAGRVVSVHVGEIDPSLVEREVEALVAPAAARARPSAARPTQTGHGDPAA
jgi:thiol-disulfide isomerase/thioredoxin